MSFLACKIHPNTLQCRDGIMILFQIDLFVRSLSGAWTKRKKLSKLTIWVSRFNRLTLIYKTQNTHWIRVQCVLCCDEERGLRLKRRCDRSGMRLDWCWMWYHCD